MTNNPNITDNQATNHAPPDIQGNPLASTPQPQNPAMQLIELFANQRANQQAINGYHEGLSHLPAHAFVSGKPLLTKDGFTNGDNALSKCVNHLLLPMVDSDLQASNTAMIPPVDNKGMQGKIVFEPIIHPKGAVIFGNKLADDNKVYFVTELQAGVNLYQLDPTATICVCFTPSNLVYTLKQYQFKAKGRLYVPIGIHELDEYKSLLSNTNAIIYAMQFDINWEIPIDDVQYHLDNADIHRMGVSSQQAPITNEERKQLSWKEINEREPFSLLVNEQGEPNRYPIEVLPPLVKDAVHAIAYHVQAPTAMAGQCVLGALSYLAQPHVNAYDRYSNKGKPCSLFLLTEGGSGDRKTSCQNLSDQRIYERQKTRMYHYHQDVSDYKNGLAKSKTAKEKADFIDTVPEPQNPQTLFKDATLEPIISAYIRKDVKDIAWVSDEAGQIFGGHTMKGDNRESALGSLTSLWDKGLAERTRSKSNANESGTAYDVRLTINTLGQKAVLQGVLNDPVMREQGFLPRFLFSAPASLAGKRIHANITTWKQRPFTDKRLVKYWERCNQLLDLPLPQPRNNDDDSIYRPIIPVSPEAEVMLLDLYNKTEQEMNKSGRYAHFKPFASRAVENATRIATVLAFFEGIEAITPELMDSAIKLAQYSLDEWERYGGFVEYDAKLMQADRVENWLIRYCKKNDTNIVTKVTTLQKITPTDLRKKQALDPLIQILANNNHVREIKHQGKASIELNPLLFTNKDK